MRESSRRLSLVHCLRLIICYFGSALTQWWRDQARTQVLRIWGQNTFWGGKILFLMICLKQSFWDTSYLGDSAPECPHPVTMGSGVIFDFFGISSQNRCL